MYLAYSPWVFGFSVPPNSLEGATVGKAMRAMRAHVSDPRPIFWPLDGGCWMGVWWGFDHWNESFILWCYVFWKRFFWTFYLTFFWEHTWDSNLETGLGVGKHLFGDDTENISSDLLLNYIKQHKTSQNLIGFQVGFHGQSTILILNRPNYVSLATQCSCYCKKNIS